MRLSVVPAVAMIALTFAACARLSTPPPVAVDTKADEAALTAGTDTWFEGFNSGDVEKMIALYSDDAVVMPPHAPATSSRDALRAFLTTDVGGARSAGVVLVNGASTTGVSGNVGWHQGVYTVKSATGEVLDSGSYMEAWRKGADGKWLIVRDIWNSDRAAAPPAAPTGS
jgi:ketosteroid isomerase-like protein